MQSVLSCKLILLLCFFAHGMPLSPFQVLNTFSELSLFSLNIVSLQKRPDCKLEVGIEKETDQKQTCVRLTTVT